MCRNTSLTKCWWGWKMLQPLWKTVRPLLKILNMELPHDPAVPLLDTCPRALDTYIHTKTCTEILTAALFTTAKSGNSPYVPLMMDKSNVLHTHDGICFGYNRSEVLIDATARTGLKNTVLSERSPSQKTRIVRFHLPGTSSRAGTTEIESRRMAARGWGRVGTGVMLVDTGFFGG